MSENKFAEIERQLQETLSELKQVRDPQLRQKMLADMLRLLVEADRLLSEKGYTANPVR